MSSRELKLGLHKKKRGGKEKAHWVPVLPALYLLTCLDLGHASHSLPCLPTIIDYGTLSNCEQANPSPMDCFFAKDLVSAMTRVTELQIAGLSQSFHPGAPWLYFLWSLTSLLPNPIAMLPLAIVIVWNSPAFHILNMPLNPFFLFKTPITVSPLLP